MPNVDRDPLDISSSSSDVVVADGPTREFPPVDPFPLDEELRRRVDRLLAEDVHVNPVRLPNRPQYIRQTVVTEHYIDSLVRK
jgi:hypothetical protein